MWEAVKKADNQRARVGSTEEFEMNMVKVDGVPDTVDKEAIIKRVKMNSSVYLQKEQLLKEEVPEGQKQVWLISKLDTKMIKQIMSVLHGLEWEAEEGSPKIYFQPFKESTPLKDARRVAVEYQLPGTQSPKTLSSQLLRREQLPPDLNP